MILSFFLSNDVYMVPLASPLSATFCRTACMFECLYVRRYSDPPWSLDHRGSIVSGHSGFAHVLWSGSGGVNYEGSAGIVNMNNGAGLPRSDPPVRARRN